MRSEREMFDLILRVAREDERIRAAYLNGSRANPSAPRDCFQDYDVVYVVQNIAPYRETPKWIDVFGPRLMLQEPERMDAEAGDLAALNGLNSCYGYLMLFADGNRIDLHLMTPKAALAEYGQDSQTVPLLDKDGLLLALPPPSDRSYWVRKPEQALFAQCCNNFWWCMQNVAKGICRGELPYAKAMLEQVERPELDCMVNWWIGLQHGFAVSPGKLGKYFSLYLPAGLWAQYEQTYQGAGCAEQWKAVFAACNLFGCLGREVGAALGYPYPQQDEDAMTAYLRRLHNGDTAV